MKNKLVDLHGRPMGGDGDMLEMKMVRLEEFRTSCCASKAGVVRANGKVAAVCLRCNKILGYMAPEAYAFLFCGVPTVVQNLMKELDVRGGMKISEFAEEFELEYRSKLLKVQRALLRKYVIKKFGGDELVDDSDEGSDDDGEGTGGVPE